MPGKTRDCTLAQNIMFKYKLVGFEFYEAMPNELSLLLTPAIDIVMERKMMTRSATLPELASLVYSHHW